MINYLIIILILFINPIYSLEKWIYIYHKDIKKQKIHNYIENYDVISLTGFTLDNKGNLKINFDLLLIDNGLKKTKKIFPLINLTNVRDGEILLKNALSRKKAIQNLMYLFRYPFYGLHIDFEYLSRKFLLNFKEFLIELKRELSKKNKVLSLAIFPPVWNLSYNQFHDLSVLSDVIDEVVLMTYDFHNPFTLPGPVTSLSWAKSNIEEVLKYKKASQIYLGIPLYGYVWKNQKAKVFLYPQLKKILLQKSSIQIDYNEDWGFRINFENQIAFFPDKKIHQKMIEIANHYQLKGVSFWRAGYEYE